MEQALLDAAFKAFGQLLVRESVTFFDFLTKETKTYFDQNLNEYFQRIKNQHSHIKTILQGNQPIYLYDIYFPTRIKRDQDIIVVDKISKVFEKSNKITIIGTAGSGKSTLIKHLFLNSIAEKFAIPILIELRYLNDANKSVIDLICDIIFGNNIDKNISFLSKLLKNGRFVFFFDGFDEIDSENRNEIIVDLNKFINLYDKNKFIITSRPYSNIENMPIFYNYWMLPLEETEIIEFVNLQLKNQKDFAKKIIDSINEEKNKHVLQFLNNPLLLSLYILAFQIDSSVPTKKVIFYSRVVQALFSEHDSRTKLGFKRNFKTSLSQEKIEIILKTFCFLSLFDNKYVFDLNYVYKKFDDIKKKTLNIEFSNAELLEDLKISLCLIIEENGRIQFSHKSLQEYFSSMFINELSNENKEKIYNKIIDKIINNIEMNNLLTLCNELDSISYAKYFTIKIVDDKLKNWDNKDDLNFLIYIIKERYKTIELVHVPISDTNYSDFEVNNSIIMKDILEKIENLKHTVKLLFETIDTEMWGIIQKNYEQIGGWQKTYGDYYNEIADYYTLEINENALRNIANLLINKEITKDKAYQVLKDTLSFEKDRIIKFESNNDELIDMI